MTILKIKYKKGKTKLFYYPKPFWVNSPDYIIKVNTNEFETIKKALMKGN